MLTNGSALVGRNRVEILDCVADLIETKFWTCITIIVTAGALLRLLLIAWTTSPTQTLNQLYPGYTDGEDYINIAKSLIETGVYGYAGRPTAFRPAGYPLLIAFIWKAAGETLTAVRIFQIVLFVIMTACYTNAALKIFGKVSAAMTAIVFSAYPLFAFITTEIATESLYMALASLVFLLTLTLLRAEKQPGGQAILAFAAGLSCGAGILTRPNMVFVFVSLVGLLGCWAFRRRKRWRVWVASCGAFCIGVLLVLTPWLIRNRTQIGAPVLTTNLEYNFFRGTFDFIDGIPDGRSIFAVFKEHDVMYENDVEDPKNIHPAQSELINEQKAHAAALAIIDANPGRWLKERGKNILYLWLNLQWEPQLLEKSRTVVLAAVSVSLVYYAVLLCAIMGSVWIWKHHIGIEQRSFVAVAWLFVLAAMPVAFAFVGKRYRVSMIDPYLILLGCAAIGSWRGQSGARPDSHQAIPR